MDPQKQNFFTLKEVCVFLGMQRRDFNRLMREGLMPRGIKRSGRTHVWSLEDLVAMGWLESNRHRMRKSEPDK